MPLRVLLPVLNHILSRSPNVKITKETGCCFKKKPNQTRSFEGLTNEMKKEIRPVLINSTGTYVISQISAQFFHCKHTVLHLRQQTKPAPVMEELIFNSALINPKS